MNKSVTRAEMEAFKADPRQHVIGGKALAYRDETGKEYYYPNRQERRRAKRNASRTYKGLVQNNRKTTRGRLTIVIKDWFDINLKRFVERPKKVNPNIILRVKSIFKARP